MVWAHTVWWTQITYPLNWEWRLFFQIFSCLYTVLTKRGQYLLHPPSPVRQLQPGHGRHGRRTAAAASSAHPQSITNRYSPLPGESNETSSSVARQVVCGLAALLQESAAELPSAKDWELAFSLLEVCGAGAFPISENELEMRGGLSQQKRHEVMCKSLFFLQMITSLDSKR